ncbi:19069_t:CDS:2 [Cetraspora pellucida]|uniref:19069_t:CDS:1 n=1 Tax=Cetraspora pellucida TaxID=1433469 RepID=A0A9N8WBE2_9GLOM|nr:19069_t:CDS:2 [Cetraspora pellucida]
MPYAPPTSSQTKQNKGNAPANLNYRGWPLTFGMAKKKQDDLNMNVISHSFASLSTSTTSTSTTSTTMNTTTNTTTNTTIKTMTSKTMTIEKKSETKDKSDCELDRDKAIQQVKEILSTSPQLSSSPRRKSLPDSYTRRMSLKVDLPSQIQKEVPHLLRKKSGELVKSSLKKGKSEPTTPTFPKYVHFNTDLEQIKLFKEAQKPQAVSRIQVQNIAFQKSVEVRYTFDFWQSVSEVSATYAEGVPDKDNRNSFDLFVFAIELIDNSRNQIDGKTMYFAVHYKVDELDYWDNNNGSNYQVNFKRLGTTSSQSASSSNKHKNSKSSPSTSSKWSTSTNNRARNFEADSPPVRSPPTINSSSTSVAIKKYMGGRYDIGLSLIAAQSINPTPIMTRPVSTNHTIQQSYFCNENFSSFFPSNCIDGMPVTKEPLDKKDKNPWENSPKGIGIESMNRTSTPIAIPSARPAIGSSSYCELVKQYCFYSGSPPVMT